MAAKNATDNGGVVDILKDLLIVQLGLAAVPQREIRTIVGCDMNRVTKIVRHLKQKKAKGEA